MRDPDSLLGQNGRPTDYSHRDNIMDKLQKILLISLLGTSVISWIISTRDQQLAMMDAQWKFWQKNSV